MRQIMAKKNTTTAKAKATASKSPAKTNAKSASGTPASSKSAAVSKTPTSKKSTVENKQASNNARKTTPFKVKKSYIYFILGTALILGLLLYNRGLFVAAVVNGQPISRLSVVKETEKQAGKQTINNLVRNTLIEQEARKQKVTVTDKEIDEEIKKVEQTLSQQGQKLDQVLALQGLTKEDLRKLIRLDKLVSKMVGKDIKVTDQEIDEYIEKNRESLPQDQTAEQLRKSVSDTLRQQQLNQKVQTWLASLQSKAKIQYFVQY
jgi:hypothetical protein